MSKRNINDNKEESYKIELLVTMNNAHPDCNKELDDILFEALEDAPFRMESVTINEIYGFSTKSALQPILNKTVFGMHGVGKMSSLLIESDECIYCGAQLKGEGGCAEDYGLHTPYFEDFYNKRVCNACDITITQTNRLLKRVIDNRADHNSLLNLQAHMKKVYEFWNNRDNHINE